MKRSDKGKSGILTCMDFFCVGKGVTSIPMIQTCIQQFKNVCVTACRRFESPKFCKLDGELSLIVAAKTLGEETRRLVEKFHARKNLEHDLLDELKVDSKTFTILMSYWDQMLNQTSRFDAFCVVGEMKKYISTLDHANLILKLFTPYFNDPSMVCEYGLKDVPPKHRGPAEVEGLFDKWKHDYVAKLASRTKLDDILYEHHQYRQMLSHRYRQTVIAGNGYSSNHQL